MSHCVHPETWHRCDAGLGPCTKKPNPTKVEVRAAELGASQEHRPADRERWAHPPYTWQEWSRTWQWPKGCGASPAALAVAAGNPTSGVGFGDGCAQACEESGQCWWRGRCKPRPRHRSEGLGVALHLRLIFRGAARKPRFLYCLEADEYDDPYLIPYGYHAQASSTLPTCYNDVFFSPASPGSRWVCAWQHSRPSSTRKAAAVGSSASSKPRQPICPALHLPRFAGSGPGGDPGKSCWVDASCSSPGKGRFPAQPCAAGYRRPQAPYCRLPPRTFKYTGIKRRGEG